MDCFNVFFSCVDNSCSKVVIKWEFEQLAAVSAEGFSHRPLASPRIYPSGFRCLALSSTTLHRGNSSRGRLCQPTTLFYDRFMHSCVGRSIWHNCGPTGGCRFRNILIYSHGTWLKWPGKNIQRRSVERYPVESSALHSTPCPWDPCVRHPSLLTART